MEPEAPPAPEGVPVSPRAASISDTVDAWFHGHIRSSVVAQDTDKVNHVFFSLARLKEMLVAAPHAE